MITLLIIALQQSVDIGAPAPGEGWEGLIEATASSASGNVDNTLLGATLKLDRESGRFSHAIAGGVNYARTRDLSTDETRTTQNNIFGQYRLEVQTGDRHFAYGRFRYDRDTFSGFENRFFLGGGMGLDILTGSERNWHIFGGPGVRYTQLDPAGRDEELNDRTESEFAFYAGSEFAFLLRDGVALEQDTDVTITAPNTTIIAKQSIKTELTERITSRLSFDVNHESNPPEGRERTDTLLRGSIGYAF